MRLLVNCCWAAVAVAMLGCRGEDLSYDCENQYQNFLKTAEAEPAALGEIPSQGPYPVAMQISEVGLNRLLAGVIDEDVPFSGQVPFGILAQGPGEATFEPRSAPVMTVREVRGCRNCVIFSLDFGVQLASGGESLSTGAGYVDMAIPLEIRSDPSTGTSTLVAKYGEASIDNWFLSVYGFVSTEYTVLSGALQILLERRIQEEYGDVELLELSSWQIGTGDVRLVAQELLLSPEHKKLALGMHTNLPLPADAGLDLDQPLPDLVPMTVDFDDALLFAMALRMFEEGEIPRRYDEDGRPDELGTYGVTMNSIGASEVGNSLMSEFRIWRVAEGYCGYATVQMPLNVSVNETNTGIAVEAGTAVLVEGENVGIGAAAEEEEQLVDDNQDLIDVFRKELTAEVAKTLNYEELSVTDSDIVFVTLDSIVDAETGSLQTWLEFMVYASEESEDDGE